MANGLFEYIRQVGGRVGGYDQCSLTLVRIAYGMGAGHAGFAHAALTRKENELSLHH
jgi:hypothetical protein